MLHFIDVVKQYPGQEQVDLRVEMKKRKEVQEEVRPSIVFVFVCVCVCVYLSTSVGQQKHMH